MYIEINVLQNVEFFGLVEFQIDILHMSFSLQM